MNFTRKYRIMLMMNGKALTSLALIAVFMLMAERSYAQFPILQTSEAKTEQKTEEQTEEGDSNADPDAGDPILEQLYADPGQDNAGDAGSEPESTPQAETKQEPRKNQPATNKPVADGSIEIVHNRPASTTKKNQSPGGIQYNKEFSVGGKMTTAGWSLFGEYTRYLNANRKRVWQVEFMELKHPKQVKQSNEFALPQFGLESPKSYVYGKQNNLYVLHVGFGKRYLLGDRADKSGVQVEFTWVAGPSLGMLKPYYLNLIEEGDNFSTIVAERYDENDPDRFLSRANIYGASGFSFGLGEISVLPGAYGKAGFHFDWANYSEFVKALEVGVGADVFAGRAPIMIIEKNKFHFVYLYLSLQLGKKW
jgi:hypothetical protein